MTQNPSIKGDIQTPRWNASIETMWCHSWLVKPITGKTGKESVSNQKARALLVTRLIMRSDWISDSNIRTLADPSYSKHQAP